jgi:diaminohydroxyphosphoribosylaminopyrimidine deaminase/5-amino-6-(5-phosphoribosylamino)uracil reductase
MPARDAAPEDARFMRRALELAERGWGRVAPNPLVGAVVARGGEVVGEGWHSEYGHPHAEVEALRAAGPAARGATIYVTLEPCAHFGQTPPCTRAILDAGVARLVYACGDPNPAAGGGADLLRAEGLEVAAGVEEERARELNAAFFHRFGPEAARTWVEVKLALTLDARVADRDGGSFWITGEEARAEVHRMRAGHDAVAVGIGTVLADDPILTVRGGVKPRKAVARVIFDRHLRTPLDSRLVTSPADAPVWIVCATDTPEAARRALSAAGVKLLPVADLGAGLRALREAGLASILVEGGARLASALLREGLVDRLTLFYAPLLLGSAAVPAFDGVDSPPLAEVHRWRRIRTAAFGNDTLISLAP